jgi:hypothetical protein
MKGRGPENEEKKKEEILEAIPSLLPSLAGIISDYTDPIDYFSDLPHNVKNRIYNYYSNAIDYGRLIGDQILRDLMVLKVYGTEPYSSTYYSDVPDVPPLPDSDEEKEGGI